MVRSLALYSFMTVFVASSNLLLAQNQPVFRPAQAGATQPSAQGQVANPGQPAPADAQASAAQNQPPVAPQLPPGFPLDERLSEYLAKVLEAWEKSTGNVERFRCEFTRWQYDASIGPANTHNTWARGSLRYMKPDKGLFKVDDLMHYKGNDPQGRPKYEAVAGQFGEHWVCDGKSVYVYDHTEKKVVRYDLPQSMQGVKIYQSPLPFLFGVKGDEVMERYWIRPVAPPNGAANEVWLEAYPKSQADAMNYKMVQVVLDSTEMLPKALIVFMPNYDEKNGAREVFEFTRREKNWTLADRINSLNLFAQEFIPMTPPKDYKVIVEKLDEEGNQPPNQQPQGNPQGERVATPPARQPAPIR